MRPTPKTPASVRSMKTPFPPSILLAGVALISFGQIPHLTAQSPTTPPLLLRGDANGSPVSITR